MAKKLVTKNCHFVAQSLTKPWETNEAHRSRLLRCFDFNTKRISKETSKKLLAKYELLTPEEDNRFSVLIEKPLGDFKSNHLKKSYIKDYRIFRALFLYFLFQGERFSFSAGISNKGWTIKEMLALDEATLNTLVEEMRTKYVVRSVNPPAGHLLFHTSVGYFSFPVISQNDQSCVWGLGVPLFPRLALTIIPNGPNDEDVKQACNMLTAFSTGLNSNYDKIIIPSELDTYSDEDLFKWINEYRLEAIGMERMCMQLDYMVRLMYAQAGLSYDDFRNKKN